MKKIFFYTTVLLIILILLQPKYSTKDEFILTQKEIEKYKLLAEHNNTDAIIKLYTYYNYSKQDFNKVMKILKKGAKIGNPEIQYMYARRLIYGVHLTETITPFDNRYKEGVYWLEKSANAGYKPAIEMINVVRQNIKGFSKFKPQLKN